MIKYHAVKRIQSTSRTFPGHCSVIGTSSRTQLHWSLPDPHVMYTFDNIPPKSTNSVSLTGKIQQAGLEQSTGKGSGY